MNLIEKMSEVNNIGGKIKEEGAKFDELMNKMYQTIESLQTNWTGNQDDYLVFMSRVAKEEKNMRMVGKIIGEYGQLLQDTATNTKTLSDTIKTTVERV